MKKLLAGIAVLAVVASAQAGLLNTWTISNTQQKNTEGTAENADKIHFGEIEVSGRWDTASGRMNNLASGGQVSGTAGATWGFTLDSDYQFTLENIQGSISVGPNGGVPSFYWANGDGVAVTDPDGNGGDSAASGVQSLTWVANDKAVWTTGDTLQLMPAQATTVSGNNVSASGRTDLRSGLVVNGTVTPTSDPSAVPEPATMSLLGLGALAIALRRKLRK